MDENKPDAKYWLKLFNNYSKNLLSLLDKKSVHTEIQGAIRSYVEITRKQKILDKILKGYDDEIKLYIDSVRGYLEDIDGLVTNYTKSYYEQVHKPKEDQKFKELFTKFKEPIKFKLQNIIGLLETALESLKEEL